jgi:chromosome partitioning protein
MPCPPEPLTCLADASTAVAVHGLGVAPVALNQRAAYAHSLTLGQTAQEYEPTGKAAEEVAQLYGWLRKKLGSSIAELPATQHSGNEASKGRAV